MNFKGQKIKYRHSSFNMVFLGQRKRRSILVLKPGNGTFSVAKSTS
jgi:hypothetical protein